MKKPPNARSRKIGYSVIAAMYGVLIAMHVVNGDLIFAALFLMVGLCQNWDVLSAWYRGRKSQPEAVSDSGQR